MHKANDGLARHARNQIALNFLAGIVLQNLARKDMAENLWQKISQYLARVLQDYAEFLQEKILFIARMRILQDLQKFCKIYIHRSCRILQDGFYWVYTVEPLLTIT